jgi:D-alanyl-D-alanine carboxypeptidase
MRSALSPGFVAALLCATACGTGWGERGSIAPPVSSAAPARPAYAERLVPRVEALRKGLLAPGVVVYVRSPELGDWTEAFGHRALDGKDKLTVDDHARIGSNTKTWTGTALLQLVDEGRVALTDPISKYVPEVPNGANITIENLLLMRSGLFNYSDALELNQALDTQPLKVWTPRELLALSFAQKPTFAPDGGYEYSNTNTVLLGLVVEQLRGKPLEVVLAERIFDKLGVTDIGLPALTSNVIPSPYPRGYQFSTNVATIKTQVLSQAEQTAAAAGSLLPNDVTDMNPSWGWAAGAGVARAADLATYVRALVEGGLIGADLQQRRLASVRKVDPSNPDSASYGWHIGKFGPLYGHTGELPGFNTFMAHDPARKLTLVVWSSLAAAPDARPPAVTIAREIITELYGAPGPAPAEGVGDE